MNRFDRVNCLQAPVPGIWGVIVWLVIGSSAMQAEILKDPLSYFPPLPALPGPDEENSLDKLELNVGDLSKDTKTSAEKSEGDPEFSLGGTGDGSKRASQEKNAVSSDWKLSN